MLLTLLQATAQASNTASKINVEQLLDRLLNWGIEVGKDILAAIIIYIVGVYHQTNQPTGQQNSGKT